MNPSISYFFKGRFKPGDREGFILKLMDESERNCMSLLEKDILSPFVPRIDKIILDKEDKKCLIFVQLSILKRFFFK